MLSEQLRAEWRARQRAEPIRPAMAFAPEGLVLGAGAILLQADGPRRLPSLRGQEVRLVALLSAFHGRPAAPSSLRYIERAAKAWSDGDDCLAYIHLAHARLPAPRDVQASACRLLAAEIAIAAGVAPQIILQAVKACNSNRKAVEKFDPNEPRVPAGSGRTSGEWTDGAETGDDVGAPSVPAGEGAQAPSLLGRMPLPATSFLGELDAAQLAELAAYAARLLGPVGAAAAVFGLLFIPSPNNVRVEGEVAEIPGLRYSWNRDETLLHLTYDDPDRGQRTFFAQLDGDVFRDPKGRVIGRVLSGSTIAIDAAAVSSDLVDEDEPRLCPLPVKDRRTNDLGLDYENYIKSIVNPENPTPLYLGYRLPIAAKPVTFDDCEHSTGTMVEIKDGYAGFLESDWGQAFVARIFMKQAMDQVQAAAGRPLRWYFSQKAVADYAEKIFGDAGLNIDVIFKPWPGRKE